jgi:hypothetical protein
MDFGARWATVCELLTIVRRTFDFSGVRYRPDSGGARDDSRWTGPAG